MTYYFNGNQSAVTSVTNVATDNTVGGLNFGFYPESTDVNEPTERIRLKGFIVGFGVGKSWSPNSISCKEPKFFRLSVNSKHLELEVSDDNSVFCVIARMDVQVNLPDMILTVWKCTSAVGENLGFIPLLAGTPRVYGVADDHAAYTGASMALGLNESGSLTMKPVTVAVGSVTRERTPILRHYEVMDDSAIQYMTNKVANLAIKAVIASSGFVTR